MAVLLDIDDLRVPRRAFDVGLSLRCGAEVVALVGPSGSGKTTVLRAVAGLERPSAGRIALGGATWFSSDEGVDLAPEARAVGWVPQEHALFPHLDVRANVGFAGPVGDLLERFGIAALAGERPAQLSGGERQRVALARALARAPQVLLLDEPLAALDAHTRASVRGELVERLGALGLPTLLVTHDFGDAAALADRVAVLRDGGIVQLGTPDELVAAPVNAFVAAFTGAQLLAGRGDGSAVVLDAGATLPVVGVHGPCVVAVHDHELRVVTAAPPGGGPALAGSVTAVAPVGDRWRVRVAGVEGLATAPPARGDIAWAVLPPSPTVLPA